MKWLLELLFRKKEIKSDKKLIVQDKAENPTAGIEIILNKTSLSETYDIGRKIYVCLLYTSPSPRD